MFSNSCLVRLFHGTKSENANSIFQNGLKGSTEGRLGPGIYLTVKDVAKNIAKHRGHGNDVFVIEVLVDVGKLKILSGQTGDKHGRWVSEGYSSCKSTHPAWIIPRSFPEWCIKDSSRLKIVGMLQMLETGDSESFNEMVINIQWDS